MHVCTRANMQKTELYHSLFILGNNFDQILLSKLMAAISCKHKITLTREQTFQMCKVTASRYYLFRIPEEGLLHKYKYLVLHLHKFHLWTIFKIPFPCVAYAELFRWQKNLTGQ
jgi:hypothetical protein